MRKTLLFLAFLGVAALSSAQDGVVLPNGSNTLKALHFTGYPGLGLYSPAAGQMYFGNETAGVLCNTSTCYFSDPAGSATYPPLVSTLSTNAPNAASSIWAVSNRLDFEGATANDYETEITATDPTADRLITLPNATGTAFLSTLATNAPDAANSVWGVSNGLTFEGATANAFELTLTVADIATPSKTVTLPDATGTVMLSTLATNAPDIANSVTGASNALVFEGATADAFQTTIVPVDPTADQVFTLPNSTGTAMISTFAANAPDAADSIWGVQGALYFEGSTADGNETVIIPTDATADRAITLPDKSGTVTLQPLMVADAVVQAFSTVKPDAGTDGRFDITGSSETVSIGVVQSTGDTVQGSSYEVLMNGISYVIPIEDQAVTRSHHLLQSSTAGRLSDSATVSTDGLNIAKALYSEPVSNVINPTGCTGGSGCINTALNTPNAGPAGQITLSADVAAAGWTVGQPVVYYNSGGTTPTGLTDGQIYWLVSVATTNVTIALTKGGAVVVPSDQGNDGTQYLQRLPLAVVSIQ